MNRIIILFLFLQITLIQLSGCSIARYPTEDISNNSKLNHLDNFKSLKDVQKLYSNTTIQYDPNKNIATVIYNTGDIKNKSGYIEFGTNKTITTKYHRNIIHQAPHVNILVEFPDGRKYPAFFDTGFNCSIYLTSDIILKNKFDILPNGEKLKTTASGICDVPELKIGEMKIKDTFAYYEENQWQFRILNIPLYNKPDVILGRELIRQFDYVIFDNKNKKLTLSKDGEFKPDSPELWSSYSFYEDPNADKTIMVKLPIAGHILDVAFDSCGWKPGLSLNISQWEEIEKDLHIKKIANSHHMYYIEGKKLPCKKATISKLSIGNKEIKNAKIHIYNEPDKHSLLSLDYFQDTSIALDYVNNLFWIKN